MDPQAALDRQIEMYRAMTPQQRLDIALELRDLACDLARAGIRAQNPNATPQEVEYQLRRRVEFSWR